MNPSTPKATRKTDTSKPSSPSLKPSSNKNNSSNPNPGPNNNSLSTKPITKKDTPKPSSSAAKSNPKSSNNPRPTKDKRSTTKKLTISEFNDLERQGKLNVDRVRCDCNAQNHDLLSNCLSCGRVICMVEGPGPCMTCESLVIDKHQQLELHQPANPTLWDTARHNHQRLLDYDATSAQRTVVIDPKADFITYQGPSSQLWANPIKLKVAEADHTRKLVDLDLVTGQFTLSAVLPEITSADEIMQDDPCPTSEVGQVTGTGMYTHTLLEYRPVYVQSS